MRQSLEIEVGAHQRELPILLDQYYPHKVKLALCESSDFMPFLAKEFGERAIIWRQRQGTIEFHPDRRYAVWTVGWQNMKEWEIYFARAKDALLFHMKFDFNAIR